MNMRPIDGEDIPLFFVISFASDVDDVCRLERKVHWAVAGTCTDVYQEKRLGKVAVFWVSDFMAYKTYIEFAYEPVTVLLEKGSQADLHNFRPGVILNNSLN